MTGSLKNSANNAFRPQDEIDYILDLPITQLRIQLKQAFQEKKFTQEAFDRIIDGLMKIDDLSSQVAIARKAVEDRSVANILHIELNTEAKQLLWAAVLTRMMQTGKEPVSRSPLWKQIQGSIGVYNEGITVANVISASLQNDEVTFDWGEPGSWFYRDPRINHMNFDLYFMLLAGFEHTRAVELHEMGHSDLSVGYPPTMQDLYEKVKHIIDPRTIQPSDGEPAPKKKERKKITQQEQVDLALQVKEWTLRQRSWNMMEDITVDQYAINMSQRMPQDFGYSMNHVATNLRGYGEIMLGYDLQKPVNIFSDHAPEVAKELDKKYDEAFELLTRPLKPSEISDIKAGNISVELANKVYQQIERATLLAGYVKNKLFSDTPENWERFRVFMEDINAVVDISGVADANGRSAFRYLFDVCAEGNDSIRLLQPKASDRFVIRDGYRTIEESYRGVVKETNEKRNQIMERIWDVYLKPFADVIMKDYAKKVEERLEQKKQQQQNGQQNQQQQQGDPSQQGSQGQGQPQSGDPSDGSSGGEPMDMDSELENDIGDMSENPGEGRKKENDQNKSKSPAAGDVQDEDPAGEGQDQDQSASGGEDDQPQDKQDASGCGEEEKDDAGQQDPSSGANDNGDDKGQDKGQQGKKSDSTGEQANGPGWDRDPDNGKPKNPKRVGDVKKQARADEKPMSDKKKKDLEDKSDMPEVDPDGMVQQAGSGDGIDFAKLAKGSWNDFNRRVIELMPVINMLARAYTKIRDEQKRQILKKSRAHDFMAEDGDFMERLDRDKMVQTKFRQATGQQMTTDDFKKFLEDMIVDIFSSIEVFYMIDGSGSMPSVQLSNGMTAMEAALQSAVIGYMACRKAGIDSYIIIWGNKTPYVIATPASDLKEVGRVLESLRSGIKSGTDLSPALDETVGTLSKYKNKPGMMSGSSHIQIFSDGDITDKEETQKKLMLISDTMKNVSIDVAVMKNKTEKTDMETVFENVMEKSGNKVVGMVTGQDPNDLPLQMARMMLKRVKTRKVKVEPDALKRKKFKQLYNKMKKK